MPGALTRRLLSMLVLARCRSVSDGVLVHQLWPDRVPKTAVQSLRNTIGRLRAQLGADVVERAGEGYLLRIDEEAVDLWQFERRVMSAEALLQAGRVADALAEVDGALALRRGEPLADVADEAWAAVPVASARELVARAEELWGCAMLRAGRQDEAVARLAVAARRLPHREVRWEQLMAALAATGRRTEALRAYQEGRTTLRDVYGTEPGPALRALESDVLECQRAEQAAPAEGARSVDLPVYPTPFVGRGHDLDRTVALLHERRLVTLTGPGGVGKTRLAVEVGRRLAGGRFAEVVLVDLATTEDPGVIPYVLAAAVGVAGTDDPRIDAVGAAVAALRRRDALVIVDNAEHVVAAVAELVGEVRRQCPAVHLLVTSRGRLGMEDEAVLPVDPLGVPDDPAAPCGAAAVELFLALSRGGAGAPPVEDIEAVGALVIGLEGLPLAIELAASLARTLSVDEVRRGLADRRRVLDLEGPRRGRVSSLRAVVEWSYERLSADDQRVFRRLAVFPGSFPAATAASVVDLGDLGQPVRCSLEQLVASALLVVDRRSREPRFRLMELHRQFGAERASDEGELAAVEHRLVACYRAFVLEKAAALIGEDQPAVLRLLDEESTTIRELLHRLPGSPDGLAALEMCAALGEYWCLTGRWIEGPQLTSRALAAEPGAPPALRAAAMAARARAAGSYGGMVRQIDSLAEAARLALESGDGGVIGQVHLFYGIALLWQRHVRKGFHCLDVAVQAAPSDPLVTALVGFYRGLAQGVIGDMDAAIQATDRAKSIFAACGDRALRAWVGMQLSMLAERQGMLDLARAELTESLRLTEGLGLRAIDAHCRYADALIAVDLQAPDALERITASRQELEELGDVGCINGCNRVLAGFLRRQGDVDGALLRLRERLEDVADRDDQECAMVLVELAEIYGDLGRIEDGAQLACTAQALAAGSGIGLNEEQRARIDAVASALVERHARSVSGRAPQLRPWKEEALVRASR